MLTKELDYILPPERIAQYPAEKRDESRLMIYDRGRGVIEHRVFRDIVKELCSEDVLVLNDTKVLRARVVFRKPTGGRLEAFFLNPRNDFGEDCWECLVRPAGRVKRGSRFEVVKGFCVTFLERNSPKTWIVKVEAEGDVQDVLEKIGHVPLPPYIKRAKGEPEPLDEERYQTVYASKPGSVAAPTAGLHFTEELLSAIRERGVQIFRVTLDVGYGTFSPIETERVEDHKIHPEKYTISGECAEALIESKKAGKRIVAVGTTVVRVLETVFRGDEIVNRLEGETGLFIYPGYVFGFVDSIITNFHLPRSSLLALVMAFAGVEETKRCYRVAVEEGYRFYSYGDAMFIK